MSEFSKKHPKLATAFATAVYATSMSVAAGTAAIGIALGAALVSPTERIAVLGLGLAGYAAVADGGEWLVDWLKPK